MNRTQRSWPRLREVARFVAPAFRLRRSRWDHILSVDDFRRLAMRRVPRAVYDYVDGAADAELSAGRSIAGFERLTFRPHVLRDVARVDTSSTILGRSVSLPVVLGPTGFTRMMHASGEVAVARAAGRAGIPYVLSTLGTTSIERLHADAPETDCWFQLYVSRDRGRSRELLAGAAASGCSTLVLTVDVPVAGNRVRDRHNGLTIPPTLSARTLLDMVRRPRWLFDVLTTEPLTFESLGAADDLMTLINTVFDPSVTIADVEWLRSEWSGSLVVKGIQRIDDAQAVVAVGADAIALSNHGGRQLDRAVAPIDLLPEVVDVIGDDAEIYLDGGVRSGGDIAAAVALGARAAFVARPYLYALMAGGEDGVDRLLGLLCDEYVRTLQLLGVKRTMDLDPDVVTIDTRRV